MASLVFLYRSAEDASVELRSALNGLLIAQGHRLWSDERATDPGFDKELTNELGQCDAIVHCVGPGGLGRYQTINEMGRTAEAMRANPMRRLVVILLNGVRAPNEFEPLATFGDRIATLAAEGIGPAAVAVMRAAFPQSARPVANDAIANFAANIVDSIRRQNKHLTIVFGPYGYAEAGYPRAAPAMVIRDMLRRRRISGFAPWLDVTGSIIRATSADNDDAALTISAGLGLGEAGSPGPLGIYLRLIAANWLQYPGKNRLFIIATGPDRRLDMALTDTMPVEHLRLVRNPGAESGFSAQRVVVRGGRPEREDIGKEPISDKDRVVLIKPFGCLDDAEHALLTAEQWRRSTDREMMLPDGFAMQLRKAILLVLGAGVFSPSLQLLFTALLRGPLENKDGSGNHWLIHNSAARVPDPLHRIEAGLARTTDETLRDLFRNWINHTYGLSLKALDPLLLLAWLDHQFQSYATVGAVRRVG
jgi:hypothetical protein